MNTSFVSPNALSPSNYPTIPIESGGRVGPRASLYLLVLDKKEISYRMLLLREDALTDGQPD